MASEEGMQTLDELKAYIEAMRVLQINTEAESLRRGRMLDSLRAPITMINDTLEDEGDRVYLGSTNDKETIKEASGMLEDFRWDQIIEERKSRNVFAELRAANLEIARLKEGVGQFELLRLANAARMLLWDPEAQLDGSFHSNEFAGELAELAIVCNVVKKLERERMGLPGSRETLESLGKEAADAIICIDKLCNYYGISLWAYVVSKFNEVSIARGFDVLILEPTK